MLRRRFADARARTVSLTSGLSPEDMGVQSMPDASPTKWHLAHTSWFFDTFVLARFDPTWRAPSESYAFLYNSYYEAVGPRHSRGARGMLTRPSLGEVREYRAAVDAAMARLLEQELPREAIAATTLGVNHEEQHQELLLTDIHHAFFMNPTRPAYARGTETATAT